MALKKFYFTFTVTHTVVLSADEIFNDGTSWRNRTVKDVRKVIKRDGGPEKVLRTWENMGPNETDIANGLCVSDRSKRKARTRS
jgi:hypothetical protein